MATQWSLNDAKSQTGRIAVVTGANTGLGFETALALAKKDAKVVLACRNADKAEQARQLILEQCPGAQVESRLVDMGSFASIRAFAEGFNRDYQQLDLLINNAGIMITPHFLTEDGHEGQLGVNHLGHFLLTGLLLPTITGTPRARIVTLYSLAANWGGMNFEDLQFEKSYNANKAYSQSKMACLMFALELNERLRKQGFDTLSMAAHPGYSQSDLSRHLPAAIRIMLKVVGPLFLQSSSAGALPTLYAALGEDLKGGEATGPGGKKETKGPPVVVTPPAAALDASQRERLWSISEKLCGISYPP